MNIYKIAYYNSIILTLRTDLRVSFTRLSVSDGKTGVSFEKLECFLFIFLTEST